MNAVEIGSDGEILVFFVVVA